LLKLKLSLRTKGGGVEGKTSGGYRVTKKTAWGGSGPIMQPSKGKKRTLKEINNSINVRGGESLEVSPRWLKGSFKYPTTLPDSDSNDASAKQSGRGGKLLGGGAGQV